MVPPWVQIWKVLEFPERKAPWLMLARTIRPPLQKYSHGRPGPPGLAESGRTVESMPIGNWMFWNCILATHCSATLWLVPEGLQAVAFTIRSTKPACTTQRSLPIQAWLTRRLSLSDWPTNSIFSVPGGIGDGVRALVTR